MVENLFQIREKEIFETLKEIKNKKFVLIGGYAVNAYTLPRFSVDCDIVVNNKNFESIKKELLNLGYNESQEKFEVPYSGKFMRFEKEIKENFSVSVDVLIDEVLDRQTKVNFISSWIFDNSQIRNLKGKTITDNLNLRIINPEALFVMKMISCRSTDIRDIFLLISEIKDKAFIKKEVSERFSFKDRLEKIKQEITSKQFKDGLHGIFGLIDNKLFEKHKKAILDIGD